MSECADQLRIFSPEVVNAPGSTIWAILIAAASLRERCAPLDPAARPQTQAAIRGRQESGTCPNLIRKPGIQAKPDRLHPRPDTGKGSRSLRANIQPAQNI